LEFNQLILYFMYLPILKTLIVPFPACQINPGDLDMTRLVNLETM
jgi:hypothetical protein